MADAGGEGLQVRLAQAGPIPLGVSFACPPESLLALVGPSGSGKTTVLRAIAGLYRPVTGRVRCAGDTWLDTQRHVFVAPQRRSVGLVFQDYALFPHLSVTGNVQTALGHLPRAQRARRASELLERVNLSGLERRRPATLSGGQQQRVAIARALARDPAVLLLDEPFSAVDQVTRRKLRRELAQLRDSLRIPVVLVTHDLEEAGMLADHMCILHHGQSLQEGPPHDVLSRPRSVQVARLVDLQNVFEGVVAGHQSDPPLTRLRWLGHVLEVRHQPAFAAGATVCWVIPGAGVILHRRDRPSRGERENPVAGRVDSLVVLGDTTSVALLVDGSGGARISFTVPTHVAQRNGLAAGVSAKVSLRAEAIQIMDWEAPGEGG